MRRNFSKKFISVIAAAVLAVTLAGMPVMAENSFASGGYSSADGTCRGSENNMTVLEGDNFASRMVTDIDKSKLTFAEAVGESGSMVRNATSSAVFMNDELFVVAGGKLNKVDPETGQVIARSETVKNGYSYFLMTGGGLIYVQCGRQVKAFSPDLNKVWESEAFAGAQGLCRLCYKEGFLYGATVAPGNEEGLAEMFCLEAATGDTVWKYGFHRGGTGGEYGAWTGSYWSGATVVGDYVVFGGEGGILYSFMRADIAETNDGIPVDVIDYGKDYGIKGGLVVSGDKIYFASNNYAASGAPAKLFVAEFDQETGSFQSCNAVCDLRGYCVATPVICKGRIYVGAGGAIKVIDAESFELIYSITTGQGKVYDVSIIDRGDCIYGYATYYKTPGSAIVFRDAPGQESADFIDLAPLTENDGAQYGAAQTTIGPDGALYFTNDSGRLMKLEGNENGFTSLKNMNASLSESFYHYDGEAKAPVVSVEGLTEGTDFTVIYKDNAEMGTGHAIVKGIGDYKDSIDLEFTIGHDLEEITIPGGYLKNGEKYGKCSLCDYETEHQKVAGYSAYVVSGFKVSKGSKSFTAKWKKASAANQKKMAGYQLRYSKSKSMAGAKVAYAGKTSKSKKIKGLQKKTVYYVQVRTYIKANGDTFYSKWSPMKSVKTR